MLNGGEDFEMFSFILLGVFYLYSRLKQLTYDGHPTRTIRRKYIQ